MGIAVGGFIGNLFAGPAGIGPGVALGSQAGGALDVQGGKVAAKVIDAYREAKGSPEMKAFRPILDQRAL